MNLNKENRERLNQYNALYNVLYTSLCLFSDKYVNNIEKAKDIVQDVFINFWNHKVFLDDEVAVKSYLYVSVKNKSIDYLRSNEYKLIKRLETIDFFELESDSYFDKEFFIEEVSSTIEKGLKTLPTKCREVVNLSMNGYKNKQISEELDISMNTVKTQKKIAYKKLRLFLKPSLITFLIVLLRIN
ncbi:RNA polymerase sigma-70 factor [Polaribacter sp. 20A6]|uniref:RNA polymerase sigma-70 factor n=1 Tax=Polaribacter sp. 20A6 TaxID=2687289 RepID=UPI001F0FBDD2|nr:RNA polymerase sigma-70 factor [Polaribacter sp. 20A6]